MLGLFSMVKQFSSSRRVLVATLAATLLAAGCGVKGPLTPAPKPASEATPPASQATPPAAKEAPSTERKP
jgi:predicted small lipoprotein YifL